MSILLQDQAVDYIRAAFTQKEAFDVKAYSGEFAAEEIMRSQFKCPAVLVGVLGWGKPGAGDYLRTVKARVVHMVAFVVADQVDRQARMRTAGGICDKLDLLLQAWRPEDDEQPAEIASPQDDIVVENLYGRAADKAGMALWMVRWRQCLQPKAGDGGLFDWVGIDIESTVKAVHDQGDTPEPPPPLAVTHDIKFQQNTPPTD